MTYLHVSGRAMQSTGSVVLSSSSKLPPHAVMASVSTRAKSVFMAQLYRGQQA